MLHARFQDSTGFDGAADRNSYSIRVPESLQRAGTRSKGRLHCVSRRSKRRYAAPARM
jgi:hypothetical protein